MNGDCGANEFGGGKNLHTMGAFGANDARAAACARAAARACACADSRAELADRWFEHAGFYNGSFFDNTVAGCTPDEVERTGWGAKNGSRTQWRADRFGGGNMDEGRLGGKGCTNAKCCTKTFPGGIWEGRGDGYDTSTIGT